MPQMSPLNWLTLMFYFIMIFILVKIMNYFSFYYINNKIMNMNKKLNKIFWKW